LPFIAEVLVLATATSAEIGTGGRDPVWRRGEQAQGAGAGVVLMDLSDGDLDLFAGQDERNEDDELLVAGDSFPTEREVDHSRDESLTRLKRHVRRRAHPGSAKTTGSGR
jgi:hypothetical protein